MQRTDRPHLVSTLFTVLVTRTGTLFHGLSGLALRHRGAFESGEMGLIVGGYSGGS